MKNLDMFRFAPHSATRVHPPSSGVIGIDTSRYLGTASTDSGVISLLQIIRAKDYSRARKTRIHVLGQRGSSEHLSLIIR
ncbi:unnamed protein product [Calypogeia fissa]